MKTSGAARTLFRSILCPVDFSAHSKAALQHAAAVASRSGGRVTALFVSDPLLVAAAAAASYDKEALEATSEKELDAFVTRALPARAGGPVVSSVVEGDTAEEIGKATRRLSADLVVIGTQGLSGASKLFFGSTTERVLRKATTPVLTVPPAAAKRKVGASWPGKRILAAVDLNAQTGSDVRAAVKVADWADAELILLHVIRPTQAPRWISGRLQEHERSRLAAARTKLERIARELGPDQRVDCQVVVGDPAEEIPEMATGSGAGLVVVTLRATGGVFGTPQGSTTYRVLGTSTTPVLALTANWKA